MASTAKNKKPSKQVEIQKKSKKPTVITIEKAEFIKKVTEMVNRSQNGAINNLSQTAVAEISRCIEGVLQKTLTAKAAEKKANIHVSFAGGTARAVYLPAGKGRNPLTGETIKVGERVSLKLIVKPKSVDAVKEMGAEFEGTKKSKKIEAKGGKKSKVVEEDEDEDEDEEETPKAKKGSKPVANAKKGKKVIEEDDEDEDEDDEDEEDED
jgi:nucleoid DNA-binding protein